MNTMTLILIVLASLLILFVVLYLALISPAAQRRNKLRRQAKLDFKSARGAVHLELMREANNRNLQELHRCRSALDGARRRRADIEARRDHELRRTLEAHILQTRLREIPGIGQALAGQLQYLGQANGGLQALRLASGRVYGIGETRQAAIDIWVATCEAQMPILLAGEFPGKADIRGKATTDLAAVGAEIDKLTAQANAITARLDRLRVEIEPLGQVTSAAFYRALSGSESLPENVERYLRGAFAEWEPVPEWFKEIVGGASA
jgi:hypothetical protein